MSTKLSEYKELSQRSTEQLWKDSEHWQSFLETSARLYKYSFKDQVMIHAQRPNAVACAEYDTWSRLEITNRFVNRGSKGIALIDDSKDKSKLRYVFDFADTGARDERSKEPFFWKINEENESLVVSAMKDQYGCKSDNADIALLETAQEIVKQQAKDYLHDLISAKNGTFLEELDDFNVGVYFEKLLENSVAYSLLSRCGFDACDYFSAEDFSELHNFNSIDAVTVLGTAVSDLSEQALRTIVQNQLNIYRKEAILLAEVIFMIAQLSKRLASFFVCQKIINEEDEEVYEYGLQLLLSTVANGLIALLIAIITGTLLQCFLYITAFIIMRKTAGGYHAKTHLGCCCILAVVLSCFIAFIKFVSVDAYILIALFSIAFSVITIFLFSPLEHKNKPISSEDKIRLKRKSRIYILIISAIIIVLGIMKFNTAMISVALGILTSSGSITTAKILKNEK